MAKHSNYWSVLFYTVHNPTSSYIIQELIHNWSPHKFTLGCLCPIFYQLLLFFFFPETVWPTGALVPIESTPGTWFIKGRPAWCHGQLGFGERASVLGRPRVLYVNRRTNRGRGCTAHRERRMQPVRVRTQRKAVVLTGDDAANQNCPGSDTPDTITSFALVISPGFWLYVCIHTVKSISSGPKPPAGY